MSARFLALGDSYTIGEGVVEPDRWPNQLSERLRASGVDVGDPQIVARTGWSSGELASAMANATFAPPYGLVTLLIGVNDQYRGLPLAGYRARLRALLRRAATLAGGDRARVLAISIPDWGATPFARREGRDAAAVVRGIDAFNAAARGAAAHAGAYWADVTSISRAPESCGELAADGLHPSAAQYRRWIEVILPAARAALGAG